jgi:hypothetical protein
MSEKYLLALLVSHRLEHGLQYEETVVSGQGLSHA